MELHTQTINLLIILEKGNLDIDRLGLLVQLLKFYMDLRLWLW